MRILLTSMLMLGAVSLGAHNHGGISADMLGKLRDTYQNNASDRALQNAMAATDINTLARSGHARLGADAEVSHRVPSKGITDQKASGRCWLFTGLNVLRAQAMKNHDLSRLELSQNYNFFYDQLEKANLFLQGIIDRVDKPLDDRMVDWLFMNPISDGGQFTGLADNVSKYGVVPREAMPETYSSENTSRLRQLLGTKLRRDGIELRRMAAEGTKAAGLEARKQQMLAEVYRMLALTLGEPPTEFSWKRRDSKGNVVDTRTYTPKEFYAEYFGNNLQNDYVMLMNDPTREYYKVYEIDYDRHTYDGANWRYLNLPMEEVKAAAIASIKDSTAMYFSCDVGKQMDRKNGTLDLANYDYESLMGVPMDMSKRDRILSRASASTHAMTLVGVDLDASGRPGAWLIENSWGPGANDGHLLATDPWMDEYLFRLVVERKYLPEATLKLLEQKPQMLPAWDFMFSNEE
ncbi:MAG: C1 family peptidase [Muribaculaceae bacterium]|nr:C1 family peptidase [Muribaculaceae bacterium]